MNLPKVDVKKILYATDLSENARYAYAYALSLADLYQAAITIIHIHRNRVINTLSGGQCAAGYRILCNSYTTTIIRSGNIPDHVWYYNLTG